MRPVALLTDFGAADTYVGVMKSVILSRVRRASFIDLTHDVPPGDVPGAALRLWQAGPWLPRGTVILAVVDPGVGGPRRAIAVSAGRLFCVGPDNGIFSFLLDRSPRWSAVQIEVPPSASATFHGRDVFAPAAARLCAGAALSRLGAPVDDLVRLPVPELSVSADGFSGEVLAGDRFGNLVTSIGVLARRDGSILLEPWLPGGPVGRLDAAACAAVLPDGRAVPLVRTFADVPTGSPLAYIGSDGLLEIGISGGSAARTLGVGRGARVSLRSCASGR